MGRRLRDRYDLAEVATIAKASPVRAATAVSERFSVSVRTARRLLEAARDEGLSMPAPLRVPAYRRARSKLGTASTAGFVLRCECGWCEDRLWFSGLWEHCRVVHGRAPSRVERTPTRNRS